MAITTRQQRQQRRNEALKLISKGFLAMKIVSSHSLPGSHGP